MRDCPWHCVRPLVLGLVALIGLVSQGSVLGQVQKISLAKLEQEITTSICYEAANKACVTSLKWNIATPLGCIGVPEDCYYSSPAEYIAFEGDTTSYTPIGLNVTVTSLDNAFGMGHTVNAGLIFQQLLYLQVACTKPYTVFARLVLDPVILATAAATSVSAVTPNLQNLTITGCGLTGYLNENTMSVLSNLRYLDLSNNKLSGTVPATFGSRYLKWTNLSANKFYGQLPDDLYLLGSCGAKLDLSKNELGGKLPEAWLDSACTMDKKDDLGITPDLIAVDPKLCNADGIVWNSEAGAAVFTGGNGTDGLRFPFSINLEGNEGMEKLADTDYALAHHVLLDFTIRNNACTYFDPWTTLLIPVWVITAVALGVLLLASLLKCGLRKGKVLKGPGGDSIRLAVADAARAAQETRADSMKQKLAGVLGPLQHRDFIVRCTDGCGQCWRAYKTFVILPLWSLQWALFFRVLIQIVLYIGTAAVTYALASPDRIEYCKKLVDCFPMLFIVPPIGALLPFGVSCYMLDGLRQLADNLGDQVMQKATIAFIKGEKGLGKSPLKKQVDSQALGEGVERGDEAVDAEEGAAAAAAADEEDGAAAATGSVLSAAGGYFAMHVHRGAERRQHMNSTLSLAMQVLARMAEQEDDQEEMDEEREAADELWGAPLPELPVVAPRPLQASRSIGGEVQLSNFIAAACGSGASTPGHRASADGASSVTASSSAGDCAATCGAQLPDSTDGSFTLAAAAAPTRLPAGLLLSGPGPVAEAAEGGADASGGDALQKLLQGQVEAPPGMQAVVIQTPDGPKIHYVTVVTDGDEKGEDEDDGIKDVKSAKQARAKVIDPMAEEVVRQYMKVYIFGPPNEGILTHVVAFLLTIVFATIWGIMGLVFIPLAFVTLFGYLMATWCKRGYLPRLYALLYMKMFTGLTTYIVGLGHATLFAIGLTLIYGMGWLWGTEAVPYPFLWGIGIFAACANFVAMQYDWVFMRGKAWKTHVLMFPYRYAMLKRAEAKQIMSRKKALRDRMFKKPATKNAVSPLGPAPPSGGAGAGNGASGGGAAGPGAPGKPPLPPKSKLAPAEPVSEIVAEALPPREPSPPASIAMMPTDADEMAPQQPEVQPEMQRRPNALPAL